MPAFFPTLMVSDTSALHELARIRKEAGDREGTEALSLEVATQGHHFLFSSLLQMWERGGGREYAEALCRGAAAQGVTYDLCALARLQEEAGDRESADSLYRERANYGNPTLVLQL